MRRIRSVTACLVALVAIDLTMRASYLAPRLVTLRGFGNYAGAVVVLAIVLRFSMLAPRYPRVVLLAVLVALPIAIQIAMFRAYGQFIQPADLVLFAQSATAVLSAVRPGTGSVGVLPLVVLGLAVAALWLLPSETKPIRARFIALGAVALAGLLGVGAMYWDASPTLEHPQAAFASALVGLLRRNAVLSRAGDHVAIPPMSHDGARPNVVLVLGESLAASHLTFYGYDRDTSPRLEHLFEQKAFVAFRDATVMGPSTRTSLPYIFTGVEGPDAHGRVFRAPTLLEYAKARGYHTAFISAQEESWGSLDVFFREGADTFRSGIAFAPNVDVMEGADDIDVLERGVLPMLQTIAEPFFIVLHMNGGHAPYAYHSRPTSKVFLPEDRVNSINAYDNTVRETDEYLARVFDALRARDGAAWMFFTSDHGQPLGEGNAFFNHGYQENVTRDPLLVFAPPSEASRFEAIVGAQVAACDLAPTILHVIGAPPAWPMDCVDFLANPEAMRSRVRVVSAYTPAGVAEPTMLLVLEDGKRELFDLARGTVDFQESETVRVSDVSLPPKIAERLR
jgi:glucan phosphoethanolaminetransferase (alkaline phosphatase superfamily)